MARKHRASHDGEVVGTVATAGPVPRRLRQAVTPLVKVGVLAGATALWVVLYGRLNALGSAPGAAFKFVPPLERFPWLYAPWTAYIYVGGGYVLPALPYLWNWRAPQMARVLAVYAVGSAALFGIYYCWPVIIARPAYTGGRAGEEVLRWVAGLDQPANCFPSSHAFFAAAAAILVWRSAGPGWIRVAVMGAAALVAASTVTVGQHYFMDPLAGVVVAWLSVLAVAHARVQPVR